MQGPIIDKCLAYPLDEASDKNLNREIMGLHLSYPDVSWHPDYDRHETVLLAEDPDIHFKAYIAVHNTLRGPARGGCRYWPGYGDDSEALGDVLRLSRGMTFKTTLAGLEFGGGKTVIMGTPGTAHPSPEIMRALGHALNELGGIYETGEDVGTRTEDFTIAGEVTDFVRVRSVEKAGARDLPGGPPLYTAHGLLSAIRAAAAHKFGQKSLKGLRVAVKGLGNVAMPLCGFLHEAGADLIVADIDEGKVREVVGKFGAKAVSPQEIIAQDADVYSPCALGGDINDATIDTIRAAVIAGAANNQLKHPKHAQMLHEKGILYVPDYAANAGGVINVVLVGYSHEQVLARVQGIGNTLKEIFQRSESEDINTAVVADTIVMERLQAAAQMAAPQKAQTG
jgi:leucine dehydrogenase